MIVNRVDPQEFFRRHDAVAYLAPASELFGVLKRSFDLPAAWAALVTLQTGEHVVSPAGSVIKCGDIEELLFTRTTPVEVCFDEDDLLTRDRFLCRAEIVLRIKLLVDRSELVSFRRAVLGSYHVATAANLKRYLEPTVREFLQKETNQSEAESILTAEGIADRVIKALEGPCFSAGLVLEGEPAITIESPSYEKARRIREETAQREREQAAVSRAQSERAAHAVSLIAQFDEVARRNPESRISEVLRCFAADERSKLYEALFASSVPERATQWIVVAAGNELLFFHPEEASGPKRRVTLDGTSGPLRSVQACRKSGDTENRPGDTHSVLVGAAIGAYSLAVDGEEPERVWLVPGRPVVRGGFNAMASVGDWVYGSHSELGIYEWRWSEAGFVRRRLENLTRGAETVRGVQAYEGDCYCAIDERCIRWNGDDESDESVIKYTGSRAAITAICPTEGGLFAGNSEGDILQWAKEAKPSAPIILVHGNRRPVESVWCLMTRGVERLFYTDTSLHVHAMVIGDGYACRYEAGGQTLKRVDVAPDLLVATNENRDRLICWNPAKPGQPSAIIPVASLVRHTIQDVCLVPVA